MIVSSQGASASQRRWIRIWSVLVSLLVMIALSAMGDREVSRQTPTAQALGPYVADFLLGTGGALDGTGVGARSLATGSTIPTASTCFAAWCGTLTVTQPLLLAAYDRHIKNHRVKTFPETGQTTYWYNESEAVFEVTALGTFMDVGGFASHGCIVPEGLDGSQNYRVQIINGSSPHLWWWPSGGNGGCGPCGTQKSWGVSILASCVRVGASNAMAFDPWTATQEGANAWVQGEIDAGNWGNRVKPALDAVIRAAGNSADLQALGITGNPPFDQPPQVRRIAIDAGHGPPGCPGAVGPTYGRLERDLVLEIAQQVAADFAARGHTIIPTRPGQCVLVDGEEPDPSLVGRVERAIEAGAEIFVSIHLNGSAQVSDRGTEVWYDPRWGGAFHTFAPPGQTLRSGA